MEQPRLRYCDILYEASHRHRKVAEFSSEDVELETSDDIRCMQQISRENVDEDYVEFLKLRLNVDEDYVEFLKLKKNVDEDYVEVLKLKENVDEDYVEFLKLHYNYDINSQSYTNECGNDGCPDEVGVEDEDDLQYKMFDGNADEVDVEDADEADPRYKIFDGSSDEEDEVDPQYKMFLANAKPDGKSYVVKVDTEDGSSVLIKYEKECECDYECEHLYCEKQKKIEMQKDAVCEKNLLSISSKDEAEGQGFPRSVPGYDSNRSMGDVDVVFEPFDPVSQRKNGKSDEEPMMAKESKPVNFLGKEKASDIDEDYMFFLKTLQCKNLGMKGMLRDDYSFEYEAAEDDVEILDINSDTLENVGSFDLTASPAKHRERVEDRYPQMSVQSEFRQKVMDLLKKPYNQNEYEELWGAVKCKKRMLSNMETRNGGAKFYESQKLGKSYLDHHDELRKKLKKVGNDKGKKLKILRGFFFWLQHLTQAGAFKPWIDTEFLALVAESS